MRKLISMFIAVMFIGCVGISIKPDADGLTVLQKSAVSTVGYLIAKNNPEYIPDLLKWYAVFQDLDEFVDIQIEYQNGMQKLTALISDDPFLQMQIRNCMSMLKITVEGPVIPEDLEKYSVVVDYFMMGVMAIR